MIDPKAELLKDIAGFFDNPLGFVQYVFPWGEEGPLKEQAGPDIWQRDLLLKIQEEIKRTDVNTAIQIAVTSGHGIGKTALVSWIVLWFISTRPHPQILVTANTMPQLSTKTWREIAKWHKLMINHDWFEWTATKFYLKEEPETWFASAIPWTEHRSEAFAGMHEEHVLVIFDEAAGIPNIIWDVAAGAMTTKGAMWLAFGNPTKNTGRFRECFGRFKHRWINYKVDSRNAKMANKEQIQNWIDDYGEDSDYVRIRVRGEFPNSSSTQLITNDIVSEAVKYRSDNYLNQPFIIGVDVARFGDDQSVFALRQGRRLHLVQKFRGLDTVQLSMRLINFAQDYPSPTVFIDGVGVGAGVVDYCRSLKMKVIEVNAGSRADAFDRYFNKRAEMWDLMRQWLKGGAQIVDDHELIDELTGIEYSYTPTGQLILEKKEDMKRRGLSSPDVADALALTFAYPVAPLGVQNFNRTVIASTNWKTF